MRLCEYNENGRVGTIVNPGKERKRERDRLRRAEQSGQKRKRLPRACAARQDSDSESSEEERPPPKVKLTLRLKPALALHSSASPSTATTSSPREIVDLSKESDSEDESMSENSSDDDQEETEEVPWSTPPYSRRSIDIPCYMPPTDETFPSYSPLFSASPHASDRPWRSPSVPFSVASPPPDSEEEVEEDEEDEEEDVDAELEEESDAEMDIVDSTPSIPASSGYDSPSFDEDEVDFDDYDTQWGESPGPMSPPAQFEDEEVRVKHEPQDVSGFLDAWESLESSVAELKVIDIITQAAAAARHDDDTIMLKREEEEFDLANWNPVGDTDDLVSPFDQNILHIKQEEEDVVIPPLKYASMSPSTSPVTPYSTLPSPSSSYNSPVTESYLSQRRYTEPLWRDAILLGPDSVKLKDLDDGIWQVGSVRQDRKSCPDVLDSVPCSSAASPSPQSPESRKPGTDLPVEASSNCGTLVSASQEPSTSSILGCNTVDKHHSPEVVPSSTPKISDEQEPVMVRTCEPCVPAICATELEGTYLSIALR